MVLLRQEIGDVLREQRQQQSRTLREVSAAARVSLGYLSEVERGQKEASSELLASICGALELPMSQVLSEVERGQKEASSELLASICGALELPMSRVLSEVSERVADAERLERGVASLPVTPTSRANGLVSAA
jgi:transcriptional regulator with XRE-family HTH domain